MFLLTIIQVVKSFAILFAMQNLGIWHNTEEDSSVNALWCVTMWPPLHSIHEGLRVWFSMLVAVCFCWVMCFDITHILSNLRTNVMFKESDMYGLRRGILSFTCNDVLFPLFSLPFFHVSCPFSFLSAVSDSCFRNLAEDRSGINLKDLVHDPSL